MKCPSSQSSNHFFPADLEKKKKKGLGKEGQVKESFNRQFLSKTFLHLKGDMTQIQVG